MSVSITGLDGLCVRSGHKPVWLKDDGQTTGQCGRPVVMPDVQLLLLLVFCCLAGHWLPSLRHITNIWEKF